MATAPAGPDRTTGRAGTVRHQPAARRDPSVGRMLARGLSRRCPVCGQGHLFRRWFTMVDTCPGCGLEFDREPGWVLGAMTLNTALTFVAMLAVMITGFALTYEDFATLEITLLAGAAAVVTPVVGYPFSKTTWIAVDLSMVPDRLERRQVGYRRDGTAPTREATADRATG